jgi:hypothetical protein
MKRRFTGTIGAREGMEQAAGGTLLLDEIGELSCQRRSNYCAFSSKESLAVWQQQVSAIEGAGFVCDAPKSFGDGGGTFPWTQTA